MKKVLFLILTFSVSCGKPVPENNFEYNQDNCKEPIELNKQDYY
jgi:hypothetical protein